MIDAALREILHRHLIQDEGLILKPYLCPSGKWTIGVGRNLEAYYRKEKFAERLLHFQKYGISEATALKWLDEDIDSVELNCIRLLGDRWAAYSIYRQAGFINFVFNVGLRTAKSFRKSLEAIQAEQWELAASRLRSSLWYQQVGPRGERVVQLICFEKDMYDG